jgi:hypothetical protein
MQSAHANVTKHVALLSAIQRTVAERELMDVSVIEQDVACYDKHSDHVKVHTTRD